MKIRGTIDEWYPVFCEQLFSTTLGTEIEITEEEYYRWKQAEQEYSDINEILCKKVMQNMPRRD